MRLPFGETDELERARAAVALVAAQIREDRAYAALQKAYGDLLASLGVDQYPDGIDLGAPVEASAAITRHIERLPGEVLALSASFAEAGRLAETKSPEAGKK